nr:hypothetical protein C5F59_36800 [Streptomyces sp. QL37]
MGQVGRLTRQADRLAEAGLIRRERDTGDRRIVRLCLTPEGPNSPTGCRMCGPSRSGSCRPAWGTPNAGGSRLSWRPWRTLGTGGPER